MRQLVHQGKAAGRRRIIVVHNDQRRHGTGNHQATEKILPQVSVMPPKIAKQNNVNPDGSTSITQDPEQGIRIPGP
jgi:hypothetical protein